MRNLIMMLKGFLAQGSEDGFGKKYARGINDDSLDPIDKYIQIVLHTQYIMSHAHAKTLALEKNNDNLVEGRYVSEGQMILVSLTISFHRLKLVSIIMNNMDLTMQRMLLIYFALGLDLDYFLLQ